MTQDSRTTSSVGIYKRLLGYAKQYWLIFVLAVVGMVTVGLAEVGFATLIEPMLDDTFIEPDPTVIAWLPYAFVAAFGVKIIGSFMSQYFMAYISRNVIYKFRKELFDKLLMLPITFFDNESAGNLVSKMVYNVEQISEAATTVVIVLIKDGFTLLAMLGLMFYISPDLTLFLLVVIPLLAILVVFISKRFRLLSRRIQDSMGDVSSVTKETVDAIREIKIFSGQNHEKNEFNKINLNNRRQFLKYYILVSLSTPFIEFIIASAFAVILYFVTRPDMLEVMSAGSFTSYLFAMILLLQHARPLLSVNAVLQRGLAAAKDVFNFIDAESENDNGTLTPYKMAGNIEFHNVSFSYNENVHVLHDINLTIGAGQSVAFVGQSGAGKTTIVNLIPRFYELTSGSILIDGNNVQDIKLASLRSNIALVSQNVTLFNDTIAHNIAYGSLENASQENIRRAAKAANALEFIEKLPDGFNTMVGENGVLLSGGQRQRLAIARAILKDAPILILDEATSALDSESERLIQSAMDEVMRDRTTLIIAHRLSTVKRVDNIVVMKDGKIVEQGAHQDLLEKNGTYSRLHSLQFTSDE